MVVPKSPKSDPVDIDALLTANRKQPPGPRCTVCRALNEVDRTTYEKLQAALDDPTNFGAPGLGKVFTALGYVMGQSPVERHRAGGCLPRG